MVFESIQFTHVFSECNHSADALSKSVLAFYFLGFNVVGRVA